MKKFKVGQKVMVLNGRFMGVVKDTHPSGMVKVYSKKYNDTCWYDIGSIK